MFQSGNGWYVAMSFIATASSFVLIHFDISKIKQCVKNLASVKLCIFIFTICRSS
jgi:hypothetical protein